MLRCSWKRVFCLLAAIVLLAGCANTGGDQGNPKPESLTTNDAATNFTELPESGRGFSFKMMSVDSDWKEDPNRTEDLSSLTYTGEAISFAYLLAGDSEPGGEQLGVRLYLNGVLQPFTVGEADGVPACTEPVEQYYFDASRDRDYCLPISFTPVCGKAGETLPLFIVFTPSPNYKVTKLSECRQGGWMEGASTIPYLVKLETDAPEQKTVDAQIVKNGVEASGEEGHFIRRPTLKSRSHEKVLEGVDLLNDGDQTLRENGFGNDHGVYVMRLEEGNILNVMLEGSTACTPLYRVQLLLDGKAVPVFDGKYYADVRMPNTNSVSDTLVSFDFDITEYPNAHTVQMLLIPLPEKEYTSMESTKHLIRVITVGTNWIRYEGDEE